MAINVGNMIVGGNTVVSKAPPTPRSKDSVKNLSDVRKRLRDPRHLKLHEIDEESKDKKVSQYMLDMYDSNELISFDK